MMANQWAEPGLFSLELCMKNVFNGIAFVVVILATMTITSRRAQAAAEVTLSGMHICCPSCVKAVQAAVAKVPGVKCVASEEDGTAALTADSKQSLQKAVDELAKAGFSGTPDNKDIKIAAIKAPEGKVQQLEITHVHNCCGKCTTALKNAIKDVPGVTGSTLEPKKTSFVVEGNFEPNDVVKALVKAGFYPELKQAK
jgi:periplasmic mercuric ion binding protein